LVQEQIKEKKFKNSSFIGGWFMPKNLCDELIEYFKYNKKYSHFGTVGTYDGAKKDNDVKESVDLPLGSSNFDNVVGVYRKELQNILTKYLEKYKYANEVARFGIVEDMTMQYYPVNGGFKVWHTENVGGNHSLFRHLVFMTYLNDIEDGGTEFFHQNIKTAAEKGLTIIWPATWTHFHRGVISKTKEKYIVTGWYSFYEEN